MEDFSAIPQSGCSVLTSSDTISNYNANIRKDFVLNGGKWYLYRTQTAINNYDTSTYNCLNVTNLDSYAMYKPFLYGLGFLLAVCVIVLFFKTIKGFLHGI